MTDIDDLIARLERAGQSPMPSVFVVREAADALREQQAKIARLQKLEQQCWTSPEQWMAWCDVRMLERAEKAEAERDALRALLLHARDLLQHNDCLPCPGNCEGCTVEAAIDAAIKGKP